VVYDDDDVFAFEDINPVAPVHILIVPKKHIPDVLSVGDDNEIVGKIVSVANKIAAEKGVDKSGFRIVANCGPDGGQEVFHLHFHLLGGRKLGRMG
jgi:histidine triad (HIT) family protein